jgi:hypothetical protein
MAHSRCERRVGGRQGVTKAARADSDLERLILGEGAPDLRAVGDVVRKLQVAIADYLESGKGMAITLKPVEIVSAIDAALAEADGQPSPWPDGADARTFFLHGLYDEIIQQPSNIFETRIFPDGSERYVPVGKGVWKACLERVKAGILRGKG